MAQTLSSLPIGAKVKFGKYSVNGEAAQDIIWLVVAKNHASTPSYPANAITLLTEKVIDVRAYDAKEPNSTIAARRTGGNNRYQFSNIDQWLNKSAGAGQWYAAAHDTDAPPTEDNTGSMGTGYDNRPAFLHAFLDAERRAILDTAIRTNTSTSEGFTTEDITRKVYLPSLAEFGLDKLDGNGKAWEYVKTSNVEASLSTQARNNSLSKTMLVDSGMYPCWTRSVQGSANAVSVLAAKNSGGSYLAVKGNVGVRPALNLSSTCKISDTTDADGCYTFVWNSAPNAPSIVAAPASVYGGKSNPISWSSVTDPEGDAVTYQLECSIDGGEYTEIYSGTSTTYAHLVPFGTTSVAYRVKATDPSGESSVYTTSATKTVVNNNAPVISGADGNYGVLNNEFGYQYTITDANSDSVTVVEAIDGVQIRAFVATLGKVNFFDVVGNTWLALPNGSHTMTITVTDGIDTAVRTMVFTKLVTGFTIKYSAPNTSTTRPSRIMIVVTRNIPTGATFKVEVCNNGLQSSPTWEDCTNYVENGLVYSFTNQANSGASWRVLIRVTVERNGATGACYVSAIGGNFE